jgi:hypothetical protein
MATVDQDGELDRPGPPDVVQRRERRPHGAPGEQHVVDQDHEAAVDALRWDVGGLEGAGRAQAEVVAVHRRVQGPDGDPPSLHRGDALGEAAGQSHTAGGDAEQDEVVGGLGSLEDLVPDPGQCPGDVVGVEHVASDGRGGRSVGGGCRPGLLGARHASTSFPASPDGSLKDVCRAAP